MKHKLIVFIIFILSINIHSRTIWQLDSDYRDNRSILGTSYVSYYGSKDIIVGTGTIWDDSPFFTTYSDVKCQLLYLKEEIIESGGVAGEINKLGFNVYSYNAFPMNGFTIKMCGINLDSITQLTDGIWTIVYSGNYTVTGTGWKYINLQTPFEWNGTDNILIEICFDNIDAYGAGSNVYVTQKQNSVMYRRYMNYGAGCSLNNSTGYGFASPYRANISMTISYLDPPTLLSPINNSTGVSLTPLLQWTNTSALSYRLQVSTDSTFNSNILINDSTITSNQYQVTDSLDYFTKYYWRVNAKYSDGVSIYSDPIFNFTTITLPPEPPVLISPYNNSINNSLAVTFKWSKPQNAYLYKLHIATDSLFNNLSYIDSTITDTFKIILGLSYNTKYWWRVKAKSDGGWGNWSAPVFNFTTVVSPPNPPVLLSPLNNSIDNPLSVSFYWSKPQYAHTYRLQVGRDSLFSDLFYNDSTITDTAKIVSGLGYNTKYWWRVKAKSDGGWGDYSYPVFSFKTIINIPNPPALVSPPNNSVNQPLSLNLVWNKSESVTFYKLLLAKDSLFTIIVLNDTTLTDTIKSISGLTYSTKYWWKVAAKNSNGSSQYSGSYNFRTLSKPCTVTWQAKITANDAGTGNDSLFFGKSPDATNGLDTCLGEAAYPPVPPTGIFDYRFILPTNPVIASKRDYRNDAIDTIVWKMTFQVSSAGYPVTFTWNSAELPVGTFYLKDDITGTIINVNMKTQNSYVLVYAGITSLKIESVSASVPGAPMLLQPDNNAVNVSLTPLMDWSDVSNALTYRLQVSTDSLFSTTQYDFSGITTSQITIPAGMLTGFTKYYWRVNASNSNGTGQWSEKRNFTTFQSMTLNLKVYLEGFWNGSMQIPDTVKVYLAGSTTPYGYADSSVVLLSTNGTGTYGFSKCPNGSYYIVIVHRNHLETWSQLPQTFATTAPVGYDFTTAQTQAYGNNLIYSNGAWCIYGGDVNFDGFVDGADMALLDNDLYNYVSGYVITDINGDGFVDGADMAILDNNLYNYIGVVKPGSTDAIKRNILLKSESDQKKTIWNVKRDNN